MEKEHQGDNQLAPACSRKCQPPKFLVTDYSPLHTYEVDCYSDFG